jgi:hypothetical protein
MLDKDFLSPHILHHGGLQLELQTLFLQVYLLKVILLLDLLRKPQVQHLLQSLNMMDELPFLHGTHQASNHQRQILLPGDIQFQVYISYDFKFSYINIRPFATHLFVCCYCLLV